MYDINLVQITGVVSAVPEFVVLSTGLQLTKFSIRVAAPKKAGDSWQKDALFFDVTAWDKKALLVRDNVSKGMTVYIVGKLHQGKWQDKETGKPMSKVSITLSDIQINQSQNKESDDILGPVYTPIDKIFPIQNHTTSRPGQSNIQNQPVAVQTATNGFEPPLNGEPPF